MLLPESRLAGCQVLGIDWRNLSDHGLNPVLLGSQPGFGAKTGPEIFQGGESGFLRHLSNQTGAVLQKTLGLRDACLPDFLGRATFEVDEKPALQCPPGKADVLCYIVHLDRFPKMVSNELQSHGNRSIGGRRSRTWGRISSGYLFGLCAPECHNIEP